MSHWKSFTNNILKDTNKKYLVAALDEMGLGLNEQIKNIQNAWGSEQVDMALTKQGELLSLGFKENKEKELELKGDFYRTGLNEGRFMDELSQKYQKHRITDQMELAGWNVEAEQVGENLELIATQW